MRTTVPAGEIFARAHAIGQYYGFIPLATLMAQTRGSIEPQEPLPPIIADETPLDPIAKDVATFLKHCRKFDRRPSARQPIFAWHANITPGRRAQKKATIQFHALGTDRAIAEAVVIRALTALARDLYRDEPIVRINSMGDKETRARYVRELGNCFRKKASCFPEVCIDRAQCDAFNAAELAVKEQCANELPSPIEHLSDASRRRFEEVLEYLEMTETPYEFARGLISRQNAWNDTCFEILVGGQRIAWGSRYHELARHHYAPAAQGAFGGILQITSDGTTVNPAPASRLRFSFVHIGNEAKHLAIKLAEELRKARIPLVQHIGIESLTEQMRLAEHVKSPYMLIMGRKEALEGTTILRDRATQTDTLIPLTGIVDSLRAI